MTVNRAITPTLFAPRTPAFYSPPPITPNVSRVITPGAPRVSLSPTRQPQQSSPVSRSSSPGQGVNLPLTPPSSVISIASNRLLSALKAAIFTTPPKSTPPVLRPSGYMTDLKQINGELYTFKDRHKGQDRLNIAVDGRDLNLIQKALNKPSTMVLGDKDYSPADLLRMLKVEGVNPENYPNTRLLMCFSGNGGSNSFAAKFQELTGKPTKAFVGPVTANYHPEQMKSLFDTARNQNRTQDLQNMFATKHISRIEKSPDHNYSPVHFGTWSQAITV